MIPHGPKIRYSVLCGELFAYDPRSFLSAKETVARLPSKTPPALLPEELMDDDQAIDFLPTGQSWMSPLLAMFGNNHAIPSKAIVQILPQRSCSNCANSAEFAAVPRCGLCCGPNSNQSEWRNLNAR